MTDTWVGIDVAKDGLVVGILPTTTWSVPNDERGIRELRRAAGLMCTSKSGQTGGVALHG